MSAQSKSQPNTSPKKSRGKRRAPPDRDQLPNATNVVASGVAGGLAPVAISGTGVSAVLAGVFLAALPPLLTLVVSSLTRRRSKSVEEVLREATVAPPGRDPEEYAKELMREVDEPWSHETIQQVIRTQLEAMDERVAPALGRLARQYLHRKQRPDRFFRGTARTLGDVSFEEYQALQLLLREAAIFAKGLQGYPSAPVELLVVQESRSWVQVRNIGLSEANPARDVPTGEHSARLGLLLARNDLVIERRYSSRSDRSVTQNVCYLMTQPDVVRLNAVVNGDSDGT